MGSKWVIVSETEAQGPQRIGKWEEEGTVSGTKERNKVEIQNNE